MIRWLSLLTFLLLFAAPTSALDVGHRAPVKTTLPAPPPPSDPDVVRQGGDTVFDAVGIAIPTLNLVGTTNGYSDDYDEVCPYHDSISPDVVYTFVPDSDLGVTVDMFGSAYDTKIYIYDTDLNLVACNDDFYSDYTSFLENVLVEGGATYYLVIDGWGGASGDYLLNIEGYLPCDLDCLPWGVPEGEPPLHNDYVDSWNGGCNYDPANPPLQPATSFAICGRSGWYVSGGSNTRDTDWYTAVMPSDGYLEIFANAEYPTFVFELGPQDCADVGVIQHILVGPCAWGTMVITGDPGASVWFWVGPSVFSAPDGLDVFEYDYLVQFGTIDAVEAHSLTSVKDLFR